MNIDSSIIELKNLSVNIGLNNKVIQASGGNTSFKSGNKMWVKASGKMLKDANKEDIFVCIENKNFNYKDINDIKLVPVGLNPLKSSIETLLHAIMPQSFIIHSHSLDVIRETVIPDNYKNISKIMSGYKWTYVNYMQPGKDLAKEVFSKIKKDNFDVIILFNHGLIVGGESSIEVFNKHNKIVKGFFRESRKEAKVDLNKLNDILSFLNKETSFKWRLPNSKIVHSLATDDWSFDLAKMNPLYPDHVVFCDYKACCIKNIHLSKLDEVMSPNSKYLIIKDFGVFLNQKSNFATEEMLEGQAYINLSIPKGTKVKTLTNLECLDLMELDSEKYRIDLIKKVSSK